MKQNTRTTGANYEKMAGEYLQKQGYEILEYNYYCHSGEIDLIAKHLGYLVFVEVKYRKNDRMGHPLEAISVQKQRKISRCAMHYINRNHLQNMPVRFDVVAILDDAIELLQNAFEFVM